MISLDGNNREFELLLEYLKRSRGFDFSGYKSASLMRRIRKRMQTVNIESFTDYVDFLEVHPEEFIHLFNTILINVTGFFRDAASWEFLRDEIIPRTIAGKSPTDPIRVWSAGCASGEEAYTVAMLLAEALGPEVFRERVKIYASDIDEEALAQARQATYSLREIVGIPEKLLNKYFEHSDRRYVFRKDLRRAIIFGRHDLIQDAPISRIDLLVCRNALMYFNAETQAKILARFHFALNEGGHLFLGKAEMLFTHANLFVPVDLKRRVFTKIPGTSVRERVMLMAQTGNEEATNHLTRHVRFREAAFDASPVAQLIVDMNGSLTLVNERARALLSLTPKDLGRPLRELELSFRMMELRPRIEEAFAEQRTVNLKDTEWVMPSGDIRTLEIQAVPLFDVANIMLGVSITFADVGRYKRLQEELEHSNQELETAYEELQSTNEELETTNEELQSTIEELETTNEELQSTNEELETINEELQSTNEELHTINEELRRRTDELNQANAFLNSILTSMRGGVVVVDREMQVQIWNHRAEDLWGLRSNEVRDKNFLTLDIGLPVEQLKQPIRAGLAKEYDYNEILLDATNRRGKKIHCKVTFTPLLGSENDVRGVILLMEEKDAEVPLA